MAPNESRSIASGLRSWSAIQRIVLSEAVLNVYYFCTVVLVAVVGAYVFHWRWSSGRSVPASPMR
jgi:hypothetical protein